MNLVLRIAATRPAFLTITALAVLVGLAHGRWRGAVSIGDFWPEATLALLGALLAHAATNVLNDVADADNGSDARNEARVAPFTGGSRFIQDGKLSRMQMNRWAWTLFAASVGCGLLLVALTDARLCVFGLAGLLLGIAYSAPPLQLMSRGWGELTVAVAFVVLVAGADFVVRRTLDLAAGGLGLALGAQAALILIVNELPDRVADLVSGKHNLIVRLGTDRAAGLYGGVAGGSYLLLALLLARGELPPACALAFAALLCGVLATARIARDAGTPARLRQPIVLTLAQAHLFAVGLVTGLSVAVP